MDSSITPPTENNSTAAARVERLAYTKAELCAATGLAPITIWRLEKKGLLRPVPGIRHRLYSVAAVHRFLNGSGVAL